MARVGENAPQQVWVDAERFVEFDEGVSPAGSSMDRLVERYGNYDEFPVAISDDFHYTQT